MDVPLTTGARADVAEHLAAVALVRALEAVPAPGVSSSFASEAMADAARSGSRTAF